ncbi:tail fiber assembly protein [Morganella morganii]|uniref:tail fiber assembly protein n=2 Tax=Morganella morganii TaxID=582 RepID=UPI0013649533|nr:tail fiber assembly protein [Morganella morganii]
MHPYTGFSYANEGSLPPLNALRIEPDFKEGFCPCEKEGAWINVPDYRGVTAYNKETARPVKIDDVGELPDNLTTIAPDVEFPKWDGKRWVTDKVAKTENDIAEAGAKKQCLIAEVNTETQILQTKLALGRIKDDEKARLNAWLDYLDELEAVDVSTAPDIIWPVKPVA